MAKKKQRRYGEDAYNISGRAARGLDTILAHDEHVSDAVTVVDGEVRRAATQTETQEDVESEVSQEAAEKAAAQRFIQASQREKIRVLLVSTDRNIFVEGSAVRKRMARYGTLFDEVHIIVFARKSHGYTDMRLAENVWAYPTNSFSPFLYINDAIAIAKQEIAFGGGFRADVVSAQDPFETGLAGYFIARKFDRAFHVQLHTDPFEPYFKHQHRLNKWRLRIARFVFPRADCVRVVSDHLRKQLEEKYEALRGNVHVLPVFTDLTRLRDGVPSFDLHEKYPQFKFIILMASRITKEKRIDFAIDVCEHVVRQYPTVGMVIVGDGPQKKELQEKVSALGLADRIVFEGWQNDLLSYFKTANLFLSTSSYEGYGLTLAEAAAAGLPVLSSNVGLAKSLFDDGVSGFVCPVGDIGCFSSRIGEFLSDNQLRTSFSVNAQERVFRLIDPSLDNYLADFKATLEQCVIAHYMERKT